MTDENTPAAPRRQRMAPARTDASSSAETLPATAGPATKSVKPSDSPPAPKKTRMGAVAAESTKPSPPAAPTPTRMGGGISHQPRPAASSDAAAQVASTPRPRWKKILAILIGTIVVGAAVVIIARWLRAVPEIDSFLMTYPGHATLPAAAPVGIPAWIGWQHFFNMFFLILIVRTGLQVRLERKAPAYWQPNGNSFFSPKAATPKKVSLSQWLHQSLDVLWVVNGITFVVLLLVTSHWMRIVPTSWDIFPNALSAGIQYASLDWPTEHGWVNYNALQVIAYFLTVFVASPLAVLSGIRLSTWWPDKMVSLSKIYPVGVARAIHFPVMLYFVGFTVVHVLLVFLTGALRNLNHMFTSRDVVDWWGFVIFLASLLITGAAWLVTKPVFMRPIAAQTGTLSK